MVEEFDTFVKPGKAITPKITELTGITNEMVDNAPSEAEALKAFLEFADGRILVAHNAHSFDIRFLRAAAKRSGIEFEPTYIDTLTMAQAMYPGLHNYKQREHHQQASGAACLQAHRACEICPGPGPHLLRHAGKTWKKSRSPLPARSTPAWAETVRC